MPSPASKPSPRQIPAQTITISSDQLGREMASRLDKALGPFEVCRSADKVVLRCIRCKARWPEGQRQWLDRLVHIALQHECPGDPRG